MGTTAGPQSGDILSVGTTTVSYQAQDGCENNQNCSFQIDVQGQDAVLNLQCPDNITINTPIGANDIAVSWDEPNANSDCSLGEAQWEQTEGPQNGDNLPVGITTVSYQAQDGCENNQNCSFQIEVQGQDAVLNLQCPDNITINAPIGANDLVVNWDEPNANSDCSLGEAQWEQTEGPQSGDNLPIGITTVSYQAQDGCENIQNCSFQIDVQGQDAVLSLQCPNNNIIINAPIGANDVVVNWNEPNVNSDCSLGEAQWEQTEGPQSGDNLPVGITTVSYQAQDGCENIQNCSFQINIIGQDAVLNFNCPNSITVSSPIGSAGIVVNWEEPNANSDCSLGNAEWEQIQGLTNGAFFSLGISTITYQAQDGCENISDCNFDITVTQEELIYDLACTEAINLNAPIGATGMVVTWPIPVGNTNCEIAASELTQTLGPVNGSFLPLGTTTIEYTFNTGCGINETCSFDIIIDGETAVLDLSCLDDITVEALVGSESTIVEWIAPSATSNCFTGEASISQTAGLSSGNAFPIGTTTITYEAQDECGNTSICSFVINVTQEELTYELSCPENLAYNALIGSSGVIVNWEEPIANTNCEIANATLLQTSGPNNGSLIPIGETLVEYTYSTGCEIDLTCSFTITVTELSATLIFECPNNITINALIGAASQEVAWPEPTINSDCILGEATFSQTNGLVNGSDFPIGSSMIIYQGEDPCGNMSNCSFEITIEEEALIYDLECPEDLSFQVPVGSTGLVVNWPDPMGTSNCQIANSTLEQISGPSIGSFLPLGITTIEYVFDSGCETELSCIFDINISVDSTTSTSNLEYLKQQIKLYPNPVNDLLFIDLGDLSNELSGIRIFNNLGQAMDANIGFNNIEQSFNLNVNAYANAVYHIVFQLKNGTSVTKRFVVNNLE